jgi:hypothetical protein
MTMFVTCMTLFVTCMTLLVICLQMLSDSDFHLETSLRIDHVVPATFFPKSFIVVATNRIGQRTQQIDILLESDGESLDTLDTKGLYKYKYMHSTDLSQTTGATSRIDMLRQLIVKN